ncbi:MAG: hypothetical protein P1U37_15085 [Minwuia sp.]|nr:hypothetical protein [Minwuia sp.]
MKPLGISMLALAMLGLGACQGDEAEPGPVQTASAAGVTPCPRAAVVGPDEIESRFLSSLAAPILGFAAEKIFDILVGTLDTGAEVAAAGVEKVADSATSPAAINATMDCVPAEAGAEAIAAAPEPEPVSATLVVATYLDDGGARLRQVSPDETTFTSQDRIVLRTTANLPGIHRLSNRTPDGRVVPLGDWPAAAGQVHDIGPFEFAGAAGTDQVIFSFMPCGDPATGDSDNLDVAADVRAGLPACRDVQLASRTGMPAPRDMFIADKGKNHFTSARLDDLVQSRRLRRPLQTELSFRHAPAGG